MGKASTLHTQVLPHPQLQQQQEQQERAAHAPPAHLPKPPTLPAPGPATRAAFPPAEQQPPTPVLGLPAKPEPIQQIPVELGAFINSLPPTHVRLHPVFPSSPAAFVFLVPKLVVSL